MASAVQTPVLFPRGNPSGVRARVTDHALRRFAERAMGLVVGPDVEDPAAVAELARRGVQVGKVRRTLGEMGGIGLSRGAKAVIVNGLKLVLADGAVVTVCAKVPRSSLVAGEAEPVPARRPRTVLDRDFRDGE
ncbi:MAG: hypothetical protein INR70_27940 [Parafilimonas terrae]|nr:hypothetical protein [Parafilimonas terrae]